MQGLTLGLILGLSACQKTPAPATSASPSPTPLASPSAVAAATPVPVASSAPAAEREALARIAELKPKVSYRRASELVWQGAALDLPLYRYDAVQTHDQARAEIRFKQGSELNLDQNTFVIIDPRASEETGRDRAVMRGGDLQGKTRKELWILTSAALLKLKTKQPRQPAQAKLELQEGKTLRILLQSGSGSVLRKSGQGKVKEIALKINELLKLPAPKAPAGFGTEASAQDWLEGAKVMRVEKPRPAPKPKMLPPARAVPATLEILSPPDRSSTSDESVVIRGRVTGSGARVLVNGMAARIEPSGEFSGRVRLESGVNLIVFQLVRPDGTSTVRKWTLIRTR